MSSQRTLKVVDLAIGQNGSYVEKRLTIASVAEEVVNDETGEKKWVMRFNGARKGLGLNTENLSWCGANLGQHTDQWIGRSVILFVNPDVRFGKERVGGLRLKLATASLAPSSPRSPPVDPTTVGDFDDEIPF
jgi:hypothetical protein